MARQVITVVITDEIKDGGISKIDCDLNMQVEQIPGSQSCLIALGFHKNFKTIMSAIAGEIESAASQLKSKGLH